MCGGDARADVDPGSRLEVCGPSASRACEFDSDVSAKGHEGGAAGGPRPRTRMRPDQVRSPPPHQVVGLGLLNALNKFFHK